MNISINMLFKKFKFRKIIFLPLIIIVIFYGYYSVPYINRSIMWKDISINSFKKDTSENIYKIDNGVLSGPSGRRILKFSINPLILIENDRVLRLALFSQMIKEKPFFTAPGVKATDLEVAVENLSKTHAELINSKNMGSNVIPTDFLAEIPKTLRANDALLKETTPENAQIVRIQNTHTMEVYTEEINNIKQSLEKISLPDENFVFNQAAAVTTRGIILNDISLMQENQMALKKEIEKANNCLELSILFCKRGLIKHDIKSKQNTNEQNVELIGKENIQYQQYKELSTVYGPYEINSYCWNTNDNQESKKYLYEVEKLFGGVTKKMPVLATELYYHEATAKNIGTVLSSQYKKHGISWEAGKVGTTYTCNDLEYQAALSTIDSYYRKFLGNNLLDFTDEEISNYSEDMRSSVIEGRAIENILFSEKYPSQGTLDTLANAFENIYYQLVLEGNYSDIKINDALLASKDELLYRANYIKGRLADYDKILNFNSQTLNGFVQIDKLFKEENNNSDFIYYMRNGYSLYYFNFSNNVWFLKERPTYVDKENSKMRPDFINYKEMINRFGEEYVNKINSIPRDQIWQEILGSPIE